MPVRRGAIGLLCLLLSLVPARAEQVRIQLTAQQGGSATAASASHAVDDAHFCSAAADPWTAPDVPDRRSAPYPFYRLVFGQAEADEELASPGPSIGLALSNYDLDARTHSDPMNDSIEVVLNGRHYVGHAGMNDPGYRLSVTYRADGRGGSFVAQRLQESGTGQGTIDLQGAWECPPVAAGLLEQTISVHRIFAGAVPARPAPVRLRLQHVDFPCLDRNCAGWRVTDEDSGDAYLARVDLSRLRLARRLRREAERGEVDLLVGARVKDGLLPRVVALTLDGVEPAPPAPEEDAPAAIPEAILD